MSIKIGVDDCNEKLLNKIPRTTEVIMCQVAINRVFFTNCYLHLVSSSLLWGKEVDACVGRLRTKTLEEGVNLVVLNVMENIIQ